MPRFRDEWVIDRVLIDYMTGGACSCCGLSQQAFLPSGTADLVAAMSDLDTDAGQTEVQALQHHPWPKELRDQIWADRVRLRQKAKGRMKVYREFGEQHMDGFAAWLRRQTNLNRMLQLPRSEVMTIIRGSLYDIHSAYAVVLCTVMEQVAFAKLTEYPPDGKNAAEIDFEQHLQFDKRGGFLLLVQDGKDGLVDERLLQVLLDRIKSLGGPKLLDREPSHGDDGDDGDTDRASSAGTDKQSAGPSFQSDRRIIRLIIARYWADQLMEKYLAEAVTRHHANEE